VVAEAFDCTYSLLAHVMHTPSYLLSEPKLVDLVSDGGERQFVL
jgi:hypothetical protein